MKFGTLFFYPRKISTITFSNTLFHSFYFITLGVLIKSVSFSLFISFVSFNLCGNFQVISLILSSSYFTSSLYLYLYYYHLTCTTRMNFVVSNVLMTIFFHLFMSLLYFTQYSSWFVNCFFLMFFAFCSMENRNSGLIDAKQVLHLQVYHQLSPVF